MPNSKRRKRLVSSNKKQIERARRRIQAHTLAEANKENATFSSDSVFLHDESMQEEQHRRNEQQTKMYESNSGWFGGLYSWCHTGITQV